MKSLMQAIIHLLTRVIILPGVMAYTLIMGIYVVFCFKKISKTVEQALSESGRSLPVGEDEFDALANKVIEADLQWIPVSFITYVFWVIVLIVILQSAFPNLYI